MLCFNCGEALNLRSTVGFKECCPKCDADLHCCRNCTFYDSSAYNFCREPQAERVVEKERANFCDYFKFGNQTAKGAPSEKEAKAKSSLDDLFKK